MTDPVNPARPALALSVDVEDWPQSSWDRRLSLGDYCADNTLRLLDLLGEFPSARATFFVLGKFARKHPAAVAAIRRAGHEIGSHGYGHVELFHLGRKRFSEDLKRSTEVVAAAAGVRPAGYRAPDFSIVGESLWALDVLAESGYAYDSSIFPIRKARYGIPAWPRSPAIVRLGSGATITELPLATLEFWGKRLPVGGGGYARLMPAALLTEALQRAHAQLGAPPVFYCHPYEIDPGEFKRLDIHIPLKVRLHQGIGRKRTAAKLRRLLENFECLSLGQAVQRLKDLPAISYDAYVLDPATVHRPPAFEGGQAVPDE
jgi:polysaccharide deacetylase family protein (PEP-CTERM system associated)